MTNTWHASDWDQAYCPSYAKICRTVVRHIQVHLYWYLSPHETSLWLPHYWGRWSLPACTLSDHLNMMYSLHGSTFQIMPTELDTLRPKHLRNFLKCQFQAYNWFFLTSIWFPWHFLWTICLISISKCIFMVVIRVYCGLLWIVGMPNDLTIVYFEHPVLKSWLRPWQEGKCYIIIGSTLITWGLVTENLRTEENDNLQWHNSLEIKTTQALLRWCPDTLRVWHLDFRLGARKGLLINLVVKNGPIVWKI